MKKTILALILSSISASSFAALDSWQDTEVKEDILNFIEQGNDVNAETYIPVEDRIAVFDHDGTLWNEKPLYIHFSAVFNEIGNQLKANPELAHRQPWKSFASGKPDFSYFKQLESLESGSVDSFAEQFMAAPYTGLTTKEFNAKNKAFLENWKHPKHNLDYKGLTYQPMIELVDYLQENDYKVYVVTADEAEFVKPIVSELYNIPPSQVIGSRVAINYTTNADGKGELVRTGKMEWVNNWANKPKAIQKTFGDKIPVVAVGNSNGDEHMLEYTGTNGGLSLWLHHTDEAREDKYSKSTDKLQTLQSKGIVQEIDMKNDWKEVWRK